MKSCSASPFLLAHAKNQTPMMDYATVPPSELIRACVDGQQRPGRTSSGG
jgi:hypothetical protein